MPLATLEQVSLAYGHVPLLEKVDLVLDAGERVALIGRNGAGKSSLLRVLAGLAQGDEGQVWQRPGLRVAHVPQEPALDTQRQVFEVVAEGLGEVRSLLTAYSHAAHQLEVEHDAAALAHFEQLGAALDAADGWRIQSRVQEVISRLGLDAQRQVGELSGGLRKRVALARALAADPELLLLDEPTNHLDITSIEWLETLLCGFNGGLLLVTHDRTFLDRVATRVVELDRGRLMSFPGTFVAYERKKAELLATEAVVNEKFDKLLAQEETWIRRGIEARRTRNEGRVRRLEQLRLARAARRERQGAVNAALEAGERSGQLVAELTNVSKSFDGRAVVRDFSCRILRGDRIGLIGPNGAGKTTLIKLILGELAPDAGKVRRGSRLSVAYYDQFREQLDEQATVLDTVSEGAEYIELAGGRRHVMSYLGDFLFSPQRVRSPVASLSGGERNRLLLARLFSKPANLLVLDEPTNDLDLDTLELLEEWLQDYPGTILLVSHDRRFLDNVVTQVMAFDGDGRWLENPGGWSEWQRVLAVRAQQAAAAATALERQPRDPKPARTQRTAKLSWNEERELTALPERIAALESEQHEISAQLQDAALYRDRPEEVKTLRARYSGIEDELMQCLARWEELDAKRAAGKVSGGDGG